MVTTKAYHYDADGHDTEQRLEDVSLAALTDHQLVWIDINGSEGELPPWLNSELGVSSDVFRRLNDATRPSHLDNYGHYFAFRVETPCLHDSGAGVLNKVTSQMLGFVVAERWLITSHGIDIPFLSAFRAQDKGETQIGALTPSLLAASLLDWHLAEFFAVASKIESHLDKVDARILSEGADRPVLNEIVAGRRRVGELRALISKQRPVFHGLIRPDFVVNADSAVVNQYAAMADRYNRAVDEVERTRDVVVGSFDLFTSMSSEETNDLVKGLTFVTAIIGFSAAVAGILGMNFDAPFFNSGLTGFLVATGGLVALSATAIILAKLRKWI